MSVRARGTGSRLPKRPAPFTRLLVVGALTSVRARLTGLSRLPFCWHRCGLPTGRSTGTTPCSPDGSARRPLRDGSMESWTDGSCSEYPYYLHSPAERSSSRKIAECTSHKQARVGQITVLTTLSHSKATTVASSAARHQCHSTRSPLLRGPATKGKRDASAAVDAFPQKAP